METYGALPAASPAMGAASVEPPADDIRGLARDDQPDLGAYEYGVTEPAPDGGVTDGSVSPGPDAAAGGDGGVDPGADPGGGCGCGSAPSPTLPGLLLWLALAGWMVWRRRYVNR